jgi:hypothetical protein
VPEEQLDAYLDTILIGGRERREIVIADYDPQWPGRFDAERKRIAQALGDAVLRIAHVGSTAVLERGCSRVELTTRPGRADALSFYEACGFEDRPHRLAKRLGED